MLFFASSDMWSPALVKLATAVGGSTVVLTFWLLLGPSLRFPNMGSSPTDYSTQTGERAFVWLDSNLTVTLNSASRVAVDTPKRQHRVHLLSGEAVFRSSPVSRGIRLTVGDLEIDASAATFDVRHNRPVTDVTVIEGQITLRCGCFDASGPAVTLTTGEQLHVDSGQLQRRVLTPQDREHLVSWQEGGLVFQEQVLDPAVALAAQHCFQFDMRPGSGATCARGQQ